MIVTSKSKNSIDFISSFNFTTKNWKNRQNIGSWFWVSLIYLIVTLFGLKTNRYYLSVFSPNTGKYGPEITTYLDTLHAVSIFTIRFSFICIFYGSIHIWIYTHKINLSGDIEKNWGPRPSSSQKFSISHENLNNITAHCYVKISLSKTYLLIHKVDMIWLPRLDYMFLYITTILKYRVMNWWLQHKNGGGCIYFRNSLPLKIINITYQKV